MTGASSLTVTSSPGPGPNLAASQRQAARLVTRRTARRAEREALDELAGAATHNNVAIATHSNHPICLISLTRDTSAGILSTTHPPLGWTSLVPGASGA
jgi:hypothetical protein